MLECGVFQMNFASKRIFLAFGRKKNLQALFLRPMARSKMVHGGGSIFLVHGGSTPICLCMVGTGFFLGGEGQI